MNIQSILIKKANYLLPITVSLVLVLFLFALQISFKLFPYILCGAGGRGGGWREG